MGDQQVTEDGLTAALGGGAVLLLVTGLFTLGAGHHETAASA